MGVVLASFLRRQKSVSEFGKIITGFQIESGMTRKSYFLRSKACLTQNYTLPDRPWPAKIYFFLLNVSTDMFRQKKIDFISTTNDLKAAYFVQDKPVEPGMTMRESVAGDEVIPVAGVATGIAAEVIND